VLRMMFVMYLIVLLVHQVTLANVILAMSDTLIILKENVNHVLNTVEFALVPISLTVLHAWMDIGKILLPAQVVQQIVKLVLVLLKLIAVHV